MRKIKVLFAVLFISTGLFAQEQKVEVDPEKQLNQRVQTIEEVLSRLQNLKISGYIQTQYQWGEEDAGLKVGGPNENLDKSFNRIGIRRGRLKFVFEEGIASGVFQIDLTEKGVSFKDVYLQIIDPWIGTNSLKAGIFDRPFGHDISYSSSRRESPERSTIFQTLFPDERDLGAAITLQAGKFSPFHFLKLQAGLFAGNGIKMETDSKKDFIGHLSATKNLGNNIKLGVGASYYNGSVYQGTEKVYIMKDNAFELNSNTSNKGGFAKREYFGVDGQFTLMNGSIATQLRGEYLFGTQPSAISNSKSPNASTLQETDIYIRDFSGGYAMLIQEIGFQNLSAVVKYDWYNPNTKVSGDEIGLNNTGKGDISYNTLGLGMLWSASKNLRLQAYYEIVKNEKSENLVDFQIDKKDNGFTLRLQYKF